MVDDYNHSASVGNQGAVMAYRQNYLDLDPTYTDVFGRPLLRMTFDFQDNEIKQMNGSGRHLRDTSPRRWEPRRSTERAPVPYSIVPYQSTHNTGGAVFGADPRPAF